MAKKRLVFHYWDGCEDGVGRLHFALLRYYAEIFDDIVFVISADNTERNHLQDIRHKIIDIGFVGNLSIVVIPNDRLLREAVTFEKYIAEDLNGYEGITLFAHSRGGSIRWIEPKYLYNLIVFLYYGCLNWIGEVENMIASGSRFIAYGGILQKKTPSPDDMGYHAFSKYKWWFQGTFQWMNTRKIYQQIKNNNLEIPFLTDRYYGEMGFLPNMFNESLVTNHSNSVILDSDGRNYDDTFELIRKTIGSEKEYGEYLEFSHKILKETLGGEYEQY